MSKLSMDRRFSCGRIGHCLLPRWEMRKMPEVEGRNLPFPDPQLSPQIPLKSRELPATEVLYKTPLPIPKMVLKEKEEEFRRGKNVEGDY